MLKDYRKTATGRKNRRKSASTVSATLRPKLGTTHLLEFAKKGILEPLNGSSISNLNVMIWPNKLPISRSE
ncbi:hypothetical protein QBC99_003064 [Beijerinckia sp. GAS462]|nr:hypothetical protein [Beijerinckia sp. GAS462]SEC68129.1 hypothetical protein SAMN05443249_3287 [Beijerinckia sp. 28-YEA-48]